MPKSSNGVVKTATLTLSSGAVVRCEPVSQEAVNAAQTAVAPMSDRPEPPVRLAEVFGDEPGQPSEPMPLTALSDLEGLEDDPSYEEWKTQITAYRRQLSEWSRKRIEAGAAVMLAQGVFPIDADGQPVAPDVMREALDLTGLPYPEDAGRLRIFYLRHWLLRTSLDWTRVMAQVGDLTVVTEEEVREALAGFRTPAERTKRAKGRRSKRRQRDKHDGVPRDEGGGSGGSDGAVPEGSVDEAAEDQAVGVASSDELAE